MALWQLISHEYRKYVFTRGFLLFLLIIPVSVAFGAGASILGERTAPVRAFTVIDQTGRFGEEVDRVLADRHVRSTVRAWDAYVEGAALTAPTPVGQSEPFDLAAPFAPAENTPARRAAWVAAGGLPAANAALAGQRPPGLKPLEAPRWNLARVDPPAGVPVDAAPGVIADALRPYLNGDAEMAGVPDGLFAALIIPEGFGTAREAGEGAPGAQFWTQNLTDYELSDALRSALTTALQQSAYEARGLDASAVREVRAIRAPFERFKSDSETGEAVSLAETLAVYVPLALAYGLLVMIMSVGGMLLTSTVEEKSNKIVEVLLSSVSATQLMAGKLIGLALVGMTAPLLFLGFGMVLTLVGLSALPASGDGAEVAAGFYDVLFGSPLVPMFFFYFVVGYLLFASLYLAVGAMSESIQDAQSFVGPMTILLVLPLPFLPQAIQDPNGLVMKILTWIPIYTPYAVMMRINNDPPLWEIVGATVMLLVFTGVVMAFMGRIYRNGVLRSGGAPKLKDALALARAREA